MITAIWASACWPDWVPTAAPWDNRAASCAKTTGSRVRAISVARPRRAAGLASSHRMLGRITSAQISTIRPGLRWGESFVWFTSVMPARPTEAEATSSRQSLWSCAPLATHRSCQLSPG